MLKLVKYDFKAYYKDFIIMICAILLLNLVLCTKINSWGPDAILASNMAISFAAAVVVVIWNISLFGRDMYNDSGYLIFTTPKSGYSILGSKIITALLQCFIVTAVSTLMMILWIQVLKVTSGFVFDMRYAFDLIGKNLNPGFIIWGVLSALVCYVSFILTVYLSITLSKVAIKNRKFGKMGGFIIFVVLTIVQSKLGDFVAKIFPQDFRLNILSPEFSHTFVDASDHVFDINIALTVTTLIITVVMFYAIGYLLEKKLDL